MPVRYRIFDNPNYLHLLLKGRVTIEECYVNHEEMSADAAFRPAMPTLAEVGPKAYMEAGGVISEEIEAFAESIRQARQDEPYRIATAGGAADARTFLAMGQSIVGSEGEHRSFETVLEALEWLWQDT